MKLINGINVFISNDGLLPNTRSAYLMAQQFDIPVKTFIYNGSNKEQNMNEVLILASEYNIYHQEIEFNEEVLETKSIFYDKEIEYNLDKDLHQIIKIVNTDKEQLFISKQNISMSEFVKKKYPRRKR